MNILPLHVWWDTIFLGTIEQWDKGGICKYKPPSLNISSRAISRLEWVVPLFGGTVAQIHYWVATVDISTIRWHTVVLGGWGGGQTNATRVGGAYDGLAAKEGAGFEIDRLPKLPSHSLIAPSLVFFFLFLSFARFVETCLSNHCNSVK